MASKPPTKGQLSLSEMREFGTFHKKTQRYIRQTLDVAFQRGDALSKWGRNDVELHNIKAQQHNYRLLFERVKTRLKHAGYGVKIDQIEHLMGPLVGLATFDIQGGCLGAFGPFRFLYERLFGPDIRPWLPSVYVAASALPVIPAAQRRTQLQSISEGECCTDNWGRADIEFYPEWVEKVEPAPPALPAPKPESSSS